jgi:hypothetical protein
MPTEMNHFLRRNPERKMHPAGRASALKSVKANGNKNLLTPQPQAQKAPGKPRLSSKNRESQRH